MPAKESDDRRPSTYAYDCIDCAEGLLIWDGFVRISKNTSGGISSFF
jgi:hypothetical protein